MIDTGLEKLIEFELEASETRRKALLHYEQMEEKKSKTEEKKLSRVQRNRVWLENGVHKQRWYSMPESMAEFCPEREDPAYVFNKLRFLLINRTEQVTHEAVVALIKRFM